MTAVAYALRCRICEHVEEPGPATDCPRCDGPRDVAYDLGALAKVVSRSRFADGPPTLWRYADMLPSRVGGAAVSAGWTPLVPAERLSEALDLEVLVKVESANPTGSYKDRTAALAGAAAVTLGLETICCTSTGNLGDAIAAEAASRGLEAIVLAPAGDAARETARRFGARVISIEGSYEECRRLELRLASLFPWGFVMGNLHPYAVEGAKTISFELAEQLDWHLPDAVVCPVLSGALLAKVAQGFHELRAVGLVDERAPRLFGVQATGGGPVAAAYAEDRPVAPDRPRPSAYLRPGVHPAYGDLAVGAARASGGEILSIDEGRIAGYTEMLSETTGIAADAAGGGAFGALVDCLQSGRIRRGQRVVLVVSGASSPPPQARLEAGSPIPPNLDRLLDELGAA